ncbi:MAG TPA: hypothetical protein VKZ49_06020 [Polyangiaceae bacterium]|nr:hypothetical protein [Polyangiaceae bacterium]
MRAKWITLGLGVLLAGACGGSVTGKPVTGGESHFLTRCQGACGDGLDCISGVCTRGCLVENPASCGNLAAAATCTDQSIEPGSVAVCDVGCTGDDDCGPVGPHHRCDDGFCRGPAPSSSGTGGDAGTPSGSGGTGGTSGAPGSGGSSGSGSGAACVVLHQTYPSGAANVPNPRGGCSPCGCEDGQLACIERACTGPMPIFECPEDVVTDPIDIRRSHFEGDTLVLDVFYSGGCAEHEFGVCYRSSFLESHPVQGSIELIHDARGDACEAGVERELRFDMTPLAQVYYDAYQTTGGAIQLDIGGLYAFGQLSCADRVDWAHSQVSHAMEQLDRSCTTAADCELVPLSEHLCAPQCPAVVAQSETGWLTAVASTIEDTLCGEDFLAVGCETPSIANCATPSIACVEGRCEIAPN